MKRVVDATNIDNNESESVLGYESVTQCPRCKTSLIPNAVYAAIYIPKVPKPRRDNPCATILNYCANCQSCFIVSYNTHLIGTNRDITLYETVNAGSSEPICFCGSKFSDSIMNLSPKFIETYNQSENAEAINLTQIAGMGYRKALEFLVKDYAIKKNPDKQNEIESAFLSVCIKKYIDNPKIQTLAEKSTWLGNDEAHYNKDRTGENIPTLKKLITACADYIEIELTVDEANLIQKV